MTHENVADIYKLTPMQQGMLFHTLYASEPGVYGVQWSCTLHGNLEASVFKRAWQGVVDRYPV
ncbi:MAG TPA: condensation domain-containing protein, partial [Herpetosiphonaceae bacterium]